MSKPDHNFEHLHPTMQQKLQQVLAEAKAQGLNVDLYEGARTPERQNDLFQRGVTKLKGHNGLHTKGYAVDIVFKDAHGHWTWKAPREDWQKLGEIGQKHGLEWGGAWKTFKDMPHFQLHKQERIEVPKSHPSPKNAPSAAAPHHNHQSVQPSATTKGGLFQNLGKLFTKSMNAPTQPKAASIGLHIEHGSSHSAHGASPAASTSGSFLGNLWGKVAGSAPKSGLKAGGSPTDHGGIHSQQPQTTLGKLGSVLSTPAKTTLPPPKEGQLVGIKPNGMPIYFHSLTKSTANHPTPPKPPALKHDTHGLTKPAYGAKDFSSMGKGGHDLSTMHKGASDASAMGKPGKDASAMGKSLHDPHMPGKGGKDSLTKAVKLSDLGASLKAPKGPPAKVDPGHGGHGHH